MDKVSSSRCFGGEQQVWSHASTECGCPMRFGLYLPPAALAGERVPVLYWLSGLTCTEENFVVKAGAQRVASELGVAIVAPDTSPRGVDSDDLVAAGASASWDFGYGAGFYVDATQQPWSRHWRMWSYVVEELPALVGAHFPVDTKRAGIFGHSMGGHGALTIAFTHPDRYRSVSAFAPICSPTRVPWGEKALSGYLGPDRQTWAAHDAVELLRARGWSGPAILVDQGGADPFLEKQLRPELLEQAARDAGAPIELRMREGYDHGYFFVSTFIEDHLRHHAARLATPG